MIIFSIANQNMCLNLPFQTIQHKAFDLLIKEGFDTSSIIVTWWDYGYWLNYFSGLTSVHDGGSQRSPKTYLVANSLTSTSQKKSYDIINYIVSNNLENVLRRLKQRL